MGRHMIFFNYAMTRPGDMNRKSRPRRHRRTQSKVFGLAAALLAVLLVPLD